MPEWLKSSEIKAVLGSVVAICGLCPEPVYLGAAVCVVYVAYAMARMLQKINRPEMQREGAKTREFKFLWIAYGVFIALGFMGMPKDAACLYVAVCGAAYLLNRGMTKHQTQTKTVMIKPQAVVPPENRAK